MWRDQPHVAGLGSVAQTTLDGETRSTIIAAETTAPGWTKAQAVEEAGEAGGRGASRSGRRRRSSGRPTSRRSRWVRRRGAAARLPQFRGEAGAAAWRSRGRPERAVQPAAGRGRAWRRTGRRGCRHQRSVAGADARPWRISRSRACRKSAAWQEVQFNGAGVGRTLRDVAPAKLALDFRISGTSSPLAT